LKTFVSSIVNIGVCLTAIPVRCRPSQLLINKETPYRRALRDPQGKLEPIIGGVIAIPEELETVILSDKAYAMGFLKC
ncbi:hypothetical protein H8356DRAFT_1719967, partial [Neocallimastix lanati (nom. inval.)]